LSPYQHKDYGIEQDVEDLDAVLVKAGSHNVFGLSTGGLIRRELDAARAS
jgi:hypothetical protein